MHRNTTIAKKPAVSNLASGFRSSNKLNENFTEIMGAFDNTLSRDGSGPNEMLAPLDMNSQRVLNIAPPVFDTDPVRLQDVAGTLNVSYGPVVRLEQFNGQGTTILAADGVTVTAQGFDNQTAFDNATTYLKALGGGTIALGPFTYGITKGVVLPRNVSLVGLPGASSVVKLAAGTRTVSPQGVAVGGIAPEVWPTATTLPTNIDAIVILGGPTDAGRWIGEIRDVRFVGFKSGSTETGIVTTFGIVSLGSVSDSSIAGNKIAQVQQGILLPDVFTTRIVNNRMDVCWAGLGVNKFTSLTVTGNYASDCRDYNFAFRDGLYGTISANAGDNLNDPTRYPTRTRKSYGVKLLGLDGVSYLNNGQEQTYGTIYLIDVIRDCRLEGNTVIGLGSDYIGPSDIAIWEMTGNEERCVIENNPVITYKAAGLLFGGANPVKHWNVLSNARTNQRRIKWSGNTVRQNRSGGVLSVGYNQTSNPPLEEVKYKISYDGTNNVVRLGSEQGVTATKNGTGDYTFTFDTPFVSTAKMAVNPDVNGRVIATPTETYGMSAYENVGARTTTSVRILCQYTNAALYDHELITVNVFGYVDRLKT